MNVLLGFLLQLITLLSHDDCYKRPEELRPKRPFTVIVEGNVGAGKSTFVGFLANDTRISTVPEPVEMWQNFAGKNLLDLMLKDGKRWSGVFQLVSTLSRWVFWFFGTFLSVLIGLHTYFYYWLVIHRICNQIFDTFCIWNVSDLSLLRNLYVFWCIFQFTFPFQNMIWISNLIKFDVFWRTLMFSHVF